VLAVHQTIPSGRRLDGASAGVPEDARQNAGPLARSSRGNSLQQMSDEAGQTDGEGVRRTQVSQRGSSRLLLLPMRSKPLFTLLGHESGHS